MARSQASGLSGNAASREAHSSLAFAPRDSFEDTKQILLAVVLAHLPLLTIRVEFPIVWLRTRVKWE